LLALALMPCVTLAQDAKVRASLTNKGECWVGQRVTLVVELLAPGYFAGAPSFDLPDPPGVLLVPPVGSPTLGSEEIDGTTYTVQRHELSVFARRAGAQTIPPLTVRFRFKRQPLDKETVPASVRTEPLSLTAKAPHGAEGLGGIISARGLTAVESWTPAEPKKAKAGDAFTRTVTYAAPDVPAMAFPPFPIARVDGLGAYPKPPEVLDHSDRGELRGERRDIVTYVCQRPGTFVIPAARLSWFDLDAQKVQTIDFPARTIEVAPNPALAAAPAIQPTSAGATGTSLWQWIGTLVVLTVTCIAGVFVIRRYGRVWIAPFRPVHLVPLNPTSSRP